MGKRPRSESTITTVTSSEMEERESEMKFIGVRKRKWGKFVSEIRLPNSRQKIWLGSFDIAHKAARAFDAAQFCLRGHNGNFNFPDNPPKIAGGRDMNPAEIQEAVARFANSDAGASQETVAYSPSISDACSTVQMESDVSGVDESFYKNLMSFGSGNFASEFEFLPKFEYYISPRQQQQINFEWCDIGDDINQEDYSLWSF